MDKEEFNGVKIKLPLPATIGAGEELTVVYQVVIDMDGFVSSQRVLSMKVTKPGKMRHKLRNILDWFRKKV